MTMVAMVMMRRKINIMMIIDSEHLMTIPIWGRNMAKRTQMTMVVALIPKMCHTPDIYNTIIASHMDKEKSLSPGQTVL